MTLTPVLSLPVMTMAPPTAPEADNLNLHHQKIPMYSFCLPLNAYMGGMLQMRDLDMPTVVSTQLSVAKRNTSAKWASWLFTHMGIVLN